MGKTIRNPAAYDKSEQKKRQKHSYATVKVLENLLRIIASEPEHVIRANNRLLLIDTLIQYGILGAKTNSMRNIARDRKRSPLSSQTTKQSVDSVLYRDGEWFQLVDDVMKDACESGLVVMEVNDYEVVAITTPLSAEMTDDESDQSLIAELAVQGAVDVDDKYHPYDYLTPHQLEALDDELRAYK